VIDLARQRATANYEVNVMNGNVIKIVPLNSWDDFIKHLRRSSYDVPDYFYRGQGDHTWSLVPTLQRTLEYPISTREFYLNRMREYLRAFRDHAHGLTGFPDGLTDLDRLLTLGRHHGLVTPILDWTRSPYVAAFFALFEIARTINMPLDGDPDKSKGRGGKAIVAIWRYQIRGGDGSVGSELRVFTEVGFPNARQQAQSSVYMHLDTHEYRSVDQLLLDRGLNSNLEKWVIVVQEAREAIADLALMNIHIASMFPDLAHAAQHANNRINYPDTFF
jgi:hypothetical protein